MQTNNVQQQQASMNPSGMEPELYQAAILGSFEGINRIFNWREQETRTKNNILHLHVGKPFVNKAIHRKKWDPNVDTMFITKVIEVEDGKGYWLLWKQNDNGDTPLHIVARFGHFNSAQKFLERANKVYQPANEVTRILSITNNNNDTALHEAARAGHAKLVKLLVEADPDCTTHNMPNKEGETPLYLAAEKGSTLSVVSILQTCNASTLALAYKGPCGQTILHAAVQWGDSEMVSSILEKDRSVMSIQNGEGLTPFHCAAAEIKKIKLLQVLLDYDKNERASSAVYIQDNEGRTPLHIAMLRKNWKAINSLIESRPDCIELVDNKGQNVVHYATKWTCVDHLIKLLRLGGDVSKLINEKDVDGNTPFHLLAASIPHTATLHPCLNKIPRLVYKNSSINLKAYNKHNLTVGDIFLSSDQLLRQEQRIGIHKIIPRGRRISTYERDVDVEKTAIDNRFGEANVRSIKKAAESRLVVSALIATISFTSGITVPGGLNQNEGKNIGMPVFKSKPAFIVFLGSDAIAFTCSTIAILCYFVLVSTDRTSVSRRLSIQALVLNTISLGALMIAFITGVSAVLPKSPGLVISIVAISVVFFSCYFCLLERTSLATWASMNAYHRRNARVLV